MFRKGSRDKLWWNAVMTNIELRMVLESMRGDLELLSKNSNKVVNRNEQTASGV